MRYFVHRPEFADPESHDTARSGDAIEVEFYFEEGFTGDPFSISIDGRTVATLEPTTRFQTGLAHVERVRCDDGALAVIKSEALDLSVDHRVSANEMFIRINRVDGRLLVQSTGHQPGYV